jgi:hypothetical protein
MGWDGWFISSLVFLERIFVKALESERHTAQSENCEVIVNPLAEIKLDLWQQQPLNVWSADPWEKSTRHIIKLNDSHSAKSLPCQSAGYSESVSLISISAARYPISQFFPLSANYAVASSSSSSSSSFTAA